MFLPTILRSIALAIAAAGVISAGVTAGVLTAPEADRQVPTSADRVISVASAANQSPVPAPETAPASAPEAAPVPVSAQPPIPTTTSTTSTTTPAPEPGSEGEVPNAEPGHLVVDDGHIVLAANQFTGSFELANVGGLPVQWTWVGDPRVAVSHDQGTIAAGEVVVVSFTIDATALDVGSNLLANCIAHDGGAIDVWITANKVLIQSPGSFTS